MRSIEFFAGSAGITAAFRSHKIDAVSLDIVNLRGCSSNDFLMDFLDFNYLAYPKDYFDIIYFGLPCTAFSKASGGFHFDKNFKQSLLYLPPCFLLFFSPHFFGFTQV